MWAECVSYRVKTCLTRSVCNLLWNTWLRCRPTAVVGSAVNWKTKCLSKLRHKRLLYQRTALLAVAVRNCSSASPFPPRFPHPCICYVHIFQDCWVALEDVHAASLQAAAAVGETGGKGTQRRPRHGSGWEHQEQIKLGSSPSDALVPQKALFAVLLPVVKWNLKEINTTAPSIHWIHCHKVKAEDSVATSTLYHLSDVCASVICFYVLNVDPSLPANDWVFRPKGLEVKKNKTKSTTTAHRKPMSTYRRLYSCFFTWLTLYQCLL